MTAVRIVVTVGTHEQPFTRLLKIAERAANRITDTEWIVQFGTADDDFQWASEAAAYFSHSALRAHIAQSDIVLTHASPAAVFDALSQNAQPLVLPRRRRYREHVNDHQVRFASHLEDLGLVTVLADTDAAVDSIRVAAAEPRSARRARIAAISTESERRTAAFVEGFAAAVDTLVRNTQKRPRQWSQR